MSKLTLAEMIGLRDKEIRSLGKEIIKRDKINTRHENENMRLIQELSACRKECGLLKKSELRLEMKVLELVQDVHHYQKLIAHKGAITRWKAEGEE